jgi:hypothetical protein
MSLGALAGSGCNTYRYIVATIAIAISIILWIFSDNQYFLLLIRAVTLEKIVGKRHLMGLFGWNDYY